LPTLLSTVTLRSGPVLRRVQGCPPTSACAGDYILIYDVGPGSCDSGTCGDMYNQNGDHDNGNPSCGEQDASPACMYNGLLFCCTTAEQCDNGGGQLFLGESTTMMRTCLIAIAGFLLTCGSVLVAGADGSELAAPTRSAAFPIILNSPDQWMFRQWGNGFLVGLNQREGSSAQLIAYDASGALALQTSISFPGSADIALIGATFDPAKNMIVAGGTMSRDGAVANFVGQLGSDGSIQQVVRLNPFVSTAICSAQVGRVWAIGWERGATKSSTFPILREYDLSKGETHTVIPRNTVSLWHSHQVLRSERRRGRFGNA
jgi:hypothetical protein